MRKALAATFVACLALAAAFGRTQEAKKMPAHVMMTEAQMVWGEAPPGLPKGGMSTVLSGDPSKPMEYTLRAKLPAGYKIPPHWHPADEHVTVLSGTVLFGMGDKFVEAEMTALPAGGYAVMPANMRHYGLAKTACVIQVHGTGPFAITYVNPADDPRNAAAK